MQPNPLARASSPVRSAWRAFAVACTAVAFAGHVFAQAPAVEGGAAPPISAEELDKLVAPIALYPDDLVAIILPAATNPLQLVQADRYLEKRKADPKLPVDEKWDDSVKALLNYPDVVKTMSGDLDWTAALGEAVVADQGAVLEAIQVFRRKTQAVGNLKSDDKQVVVVEKEVIQIVPANPEVIYVPQYNPVTIVAAPGYPWGYWPTPYPVYYYPYPPGAAFATGLIWGAAIGAAWNGGHWNTNWGGGDININRNTNVNVNIDRGRRDDASGSGWRYGMEIGQATGTGQQHGRPDAVDGAGRRCAARWVRRRRRRARPTQTAGGSLGGGAGQGAVASNRAGSASAAQRAGSVSASPRDSYGGASGSRGGASAGGAMSGYGSGRQTQMDSSRGASSRSSMSGGASRSMSGGGGARGGGGGGRGGGGRR